MKRKITKKIIKTLLWIVGIFIALDLLVVGLIFVPPIQEKIVGVVTEKLSEKWNSKITIGHIYLSPTLKLYVEDFTIHDAHGNPMLGAKKLKSRLTSLQLDPIKVGLSDIDSEGLKVIVRKYKGDDAVNISLWAKNFKKEKKNPQPFVMSSSAIILKNAYFLYRNDAVCTTKDAGKIDFGYFELKNINATLNHFNLVGSDISADFDHLALTQYTGFKLLNLSGKFHIGPSGLSIKNATVATPNSRIFMDFAFEYDNWQDYGDFLNKINFNVKAKTSTVNMCDICYFAPQTEGMDNELVFSAIVKGPINNLNITNLDARFADNTHFVGDLTLDHVTDFFNADIKAKFAQTTVDLNELKEFKLPGGKTIPIPEQVARLGQVTMDLEYEGVVSDNFAVKTNMLTDFGDIVADFATASHDGDDGVDFSADVSTKGLAINKLLPSVNMVGGVTGKVSAKGSVADMNDLAATLVTDVKADISRIQLKGYPLQHLRASGKYGNKKLAAQATLNDPNCALAFNGNMDLSKKQNEYHAEASIDNLNFSKLFAHLPLVDSTTTDGFEKLVRYVQLHPEVTLNVSHLDCDLAGNKLKEMNGDVFIDSISYTQDGKSLAMDRVRLISLASDEKQILRFSSDLANVVLSTNYDIKDVPTAIIDMVYTYCGNLLPARNVSAPLYADVENPEFDLDVTAHHLTPILEMFAPTIRIGDNSVVKIRGDANHSQDYINVSSPEIYIGDNVQIQQVQLLANSKGTASFKANGSVRSLLIGEKGNFAFDNISMEADVDPQTLACRLDWNNPAVISSHKSLLGTRVNFLDGGKITAQITESEVYFKEFPFSFNKDHLVTVDHGTVKIDNVVLNSNESQVFVNGYVGKVGDSLVATIDNLGIDLVNQFIKTDKMHLGGALSANVQMRDFNGRNLLLGSALIKDFEFNGEQFGHLYANAILPSDKNIHFRGGLINAEDFPEGATVFNYTYNQDFKNQKGVNTHLDGLFDTDKKRLKVTADIDTLPLGFLEPMLSSFSHKFAGNASGNIDFILAPDSMYFKGQANVREAEVGIAPLNTIYYLKNQVIDFTEDGFSFNNVDLTDKFDNHATMNGYVNHRNFSDFTLDLRISTPKIFVLNTKQEADVPFYGDGFVSGDITIAGNTEKLSFFGDNLSTQSGTVFCLPISFADKVYDSDVISFVVPESERKEEVETVEAPESDMEMDFDFIFNVTPAADIKLDLDLSAFGGKIKTKGEGQLHFTYNTKVDKINILGDVVLQSGSFMMTFAQLLNKKFDLQPGGIVTFPGSLYDININVQAAYSTTASLSDLFTSENTNVRRMPVKAFLNFNGNLNDPAAIDFSFDLPNATPDFKTLFYSTIDTSNIQRKTEQFFSLVMLGKFASAQTNIANINIENTGIGVLTSTLSNFLSNQLKYVDVNLNYQNATADKAAEYAVGASTSLFNDRTVIETYVGYKDDKASGLSNQLIGDFSIEQKLNELGTWRLKVFNVTNQDELRNATRNNPYAQGIAVIYKQDFNNRRDLVASYIRNKKKDSEKAKARREKRAKRKDVQNTEAILPDNKED